MFEWSIDWLISKNGQLTGKFISQVKVAKSQPYAGRWHGEERVYPCEPAGMLGGRWVGIPREWLEGHYMAVWCQYLISGA